MENQKLVAGQQSFKMVIPAYVESKIRRALQLFPNTEWSGILFYTYTGSIETKDLVVTCQDIHPMNIGVGAYTQFEEDSSIVGFMVDNDLLDCQYGLIHSHHVMSTNFSGEDCNTLLVEGAERNNFVSLIVNHAGTYSARITSKEHCQVKAKKYITIPFFGTEKKREEDAEAEYVTVYYHNLNIEFGKPQYDLSDFEARFEELKKTAGQFSVNERSAWNNKDKTKPATSSVVDSIIESMPNRGITTPQKPGTQLELDLGEEYKRPTAEEYEEEIPMEPIFIEESIIESATAQLLSGSITATHVPKKADVYKQLGARFESRIINKNEMEFVISNLVTNVIESMIDHIDDPTIPDDIKMSDLAQACYTRIEALELNYPYIDEILEDLENYVANR